MLEADLRDHPGEVGVDAASAAFKTYALFRTQRYYGIDIDLRALEIGRIEHPEAIGIVGDIAELELPSCSADVVVSTNTLHWLEPDQRRAAERRLIDLVKPDGVLVIECEKNELLAGTLEHIRQEYADVDVRYFGVWLSRKYEDWLGARAALEWKQGPMRYVRVGVAMVLSWLELLFPHCSATRGYAYIRARRRRGELTVQRFEVDPARLVGDGIYAAS